MKSLLGTVMGIGILALSAPALVGCNPCQEDGDLVICGDFGTLAYSVMPPGWALDVRWPPAATERSTLVVTTDAEVFEVSEGGSIQTVEVLSELSSPPSVGRDGTIYLVSGTQAYALGADGRSGEPMMWTQSVHGESPTTPPAVGGGEVHVAMRSWDREQRTLVSLDAQTGEITQSRDGASPTAIAFDGTLRYLQGPQDCGARFDELVAENEDGSVRWRHAEADGIHDFAPGPDGEVYVVTGKRVLRRISEQGETEWSFEPDCEDCNVAAAPTVTEDRVYFPVWQGWTANMGCDQPEEEPMVQDAIDPLYALSREGKRLWTYDGFDTMSAQSSGADAMLGVLSLTMAQKVRHHPAGRPTVAEDGTLYVATDGAVVALDADGKQLGYAMFQPQAGEVRTGDGGIMTTSTATVTGVTRSPVLAPDGSLFMWDGTQIRAFETERPAAKIPWSAPFGGYRNDGRVGG